MSEAVSAFPASGRRAELRENTRRRLLAIGRRAFAEKGLAGVNLKDDILVPARVSVGSFYHQFADKTELFLEILRDHSATFRAMIHEAHTPRALELPAQIARHSYETVFRIAEENEDLFRIMMRERNSPDSRIQEYMSENYALWVQSLSADYQRMGFVPDSIAEARLAAELIIALTLGTVVRYLEEPRSRRPRMRERLIHGLVQFTLGGVPALLEADRAGEPPAGKARPNGT